MTGKQKAFVSYYLGEANFNATLAAKMAGYRATSKHSFESIGSENLTRPDIAARIDEHFKQAHVSAEEVLLELGTLARGDSRDKIKALALLSQHHGLLDPIKWQAKQLTEAEGRYDQQLREYQVEIGGEIEELNRQGQAIYEEAKKKFAASPDVAAFTKHYEAMLNGKTQEPAAEVEVEIIPPQRRLAPAPVERMMADVIDIQAHESSPPLKCRHGYEDGQCFTCNHWPDERAPKPVPKEARFG